MLGWVKGRAGLHGKLLLEIGGAIEEAVHHLKYHDTLISHHFLVTLEVACETNDGRRGVNTSS